MFVPFDGEESPRGSDATSSATACAAPRSRRARFGDAEAMVLLDFVGDKRLSIPREAQLGHELLWRKLRAAARAGRAPARRFPDATQGAISDDHMPVHRAGRARRST